MFKLKSQPPAAPPPDLWLAVPHSSKVHAEVRLPTSLIFAVTPLLPLCPSATDALRD